MAKKKTTKVLSLKDIDKKYGTVTKASTILLEYDRTLRIPSRCPWLNWQIGGGFPYGKIIELFGYESTGKSLLAKDFSITTQLLGGVVLWVDAEHALDLQWAKQVGIDLEKLYIYEESNSVEKISDWIRDISISMRAQLTNNQPILVVVDSLAALDTEINIGSDQLDKKAQMGNRAKAIGDMWRLRNFDFKRYGITVIAINQVRKKLGASMFESNETVPGGESTKFYSSIRLATIGSKQIKGVIKDGKFSEDTKGIKMGRNIYVSVEKNKTFPPRNRVKTQVYFTPHIYSYVGYSKYEGLADILIDENILYKKGNAYYFKSKKHGEVKLCGKYDDITNALEENEEYRKIILKKLKVNTVSKTQLQLDNITHNMFPVINSTNDEE